MITITVLSIRQPWAWLIVNGYKTVENRTWRTKYRGRLYIHASQRPDFDFATTDEFRVELAEIGIVLPNHFDLGGIVGVANLIDCVATCTDEYDADWHQPDMIAWVLRDSQPLPFYPVKGRLNLFHLDYPSSHAAIDKE